MHIIVDQICFHPGQELFLAKVDEPGSHYGSSLGNASATARTAHEAIVLLGAAVSLADKVLAERAERG